MSNKVKFGLKNLYIASVTVGEQNVISKNMMIADRRRTLGNGEDHKSR